MKRKYFKKFSDQEILYAIKQSNSMKSTLEKLNLKNSTCHKYLKKYILENKISIEHFEKIGRKKYHFDENFFDDIDNFSKAYWLGFIVADGCLSKISKCSYALTIKLHKKDINHIEKFKQSIKANHPIQIYNEQPQIKLVSENLGKSLIKLGVIPNKTQKGCYIPDIPNELINSFILGYFDGDGCVYINKNSISVEFVGNNNILHQIKDKFLLFLKNNKIKINEYDNYSTMSYGGNVQIEKIFHYLYHKCEFCLERKHQKFCQFYKNWKPKKFNYSKELLQDLVPICLSMHQLCKALRYSHSNTIITNNIKKKLLEYKIDYSHFKNNSKKIDNVDKINFILAKHNY
jgi:hypothetical protein